MSEQDKQQPVPVEIEGDWQTWWYVCGESHSALDYKVQICPTCKRPVKWDE